MNTKVWCCECAVLRRFGKPNTIITDTLKQNKRHRWNGKTQKYTTFFSVRSTQLDENEKWLARSEYPYIDNDTNRKKTECQSGNSQNKMKIHIKCNWNRRALIRNTYIAFSISSAPLRTTQTLSRWKIKKNYIFTMNSHIYTNSTHLCHHPSSIILLHQLIFFILASFHVCWGFFFSFSYVANVYEL